MTEDARYLGIDTSVDHDLLWIAEEALEAPLPSEWTEHFDSSDGERYYFNKTTEGISVTHPLENLYRDAYKTIVHFRGAMSPQDRVDELLKLQQECQQMEREVQDECTAWEECEGDEGAAREGNEDLAWLELVVPHNYSPWVCSCAWMGLQRSNPPLCQLRTV